MAKIDTTLIPNYDDLSAEDKVKAFESFEYDDHTADLDSLKRALDKANSEAADWKRKHHELLSEEERKRQEDAEKQAQMAQELSDLRREKEVASYKAKFLSQGYQEDLAEKTAAALVDGDMSTVFANQSAFLIEYAKQLKADALKDTPRPPAGLGSSGMTLEKLKSLPNEEYNKFATEHPEEFKALYKEGEK